MIERRFGRVLFVSSIAGLNGGVVGAHYAASKAGLHGLMHHLALRVWDRRRHRQCAGACTGRPHPDVSRRSGDRNRSGAHPCRPCWGPDEVADMAIAMLRNGYLTNKVITLDGGILPR